MLPNGKWQSVPCGKCNGCLLHKANEWSQRLCTEIENTALTLFCTLTYSDKYLPRLMFDKDRFLYTSDCGSANVRFDGTKDVFRCRRKEDLFEFTCATHLDLLTPQHTSWPDSVSYLCKRDFQLWLKLVRKSIDLRFPDYDYKRKRFRYFICGEYGPTTYRCHAHALLFFYDYEVSEYCRQFALYENWKMCDKVLFDNYTRYADGGTAGYVTNYVTGFSSLPSLLRESSICPFRLSSKNPAIGYSSFDKVEVFQKVLDGDLTYSKRVSRLERKYVLRYPKGYIASLFPKCYRFGELPFSRLLEIYGSIFTQVRRHGYEYHVCAKRLRNSMHSSDFNAARACYKFCEKFGSAPYVYVNLVCEVYYKIDMANLRMFYERQQLVTTPVERLAFYTNLSLFWSEYVRLGKDISLFRDWFANFGICVDDISDSRGFKLLLDTVDWQKDTYILELEEIVKNCVKVPKFNEKFGFAPHIV